MTAKTLKKKYPELWNNVYDSMIETLLSTMRQADIEEYTDGNKKCRIITIANNAAFMACIEHFRLTTQNKKYKRINP